MSVESLMNAVSSGVKTASRTFKSLSQLDGIANEIIRDVNEGVKSYKYLLAQNEIEAATGQLVTLWTKGQYLPSVQLITQDEKRKSLKFAHLLNKMISAGQSGNIDVLSGAVSEMKKEASDFDDTEILSNIQGVKLASGMHIAQARIAVSKGDLQTVQTEITRAAAVWPNNPELQSFSADMSKMSEKASPQVQAVNDFDQLYGQKNFRQIFEEKEKYIAAISQTPERQGKLREVLSRMQEIETSIMRSQEIARRGDYAGAWEGLEMTFGHYPDDTKLAQMRAELTTQAPDFVHDIREAKAYEVRKEYGSALAWYLRSQTRYPMSDLSKQGIQRVAKQILPDSN
jgi:tetratricopeptide (TPR) repeat protein